MKYSTTVTNNNYIKKYTKYKWRRKYTKYIFSIQGNMNNLGFLIKYNRIRNKISQEELSQGICSPWQSSQL
jgi:hypothetical protein